MYKQALTALLLAIGSGLALSSASCGTCPAGQQSCGTANGSTAGAGAVDGGADSCALLTALRTCMTAFCATTSNPFCTCYKRGFDIDSSSCKCVDIDAKSYCAQANSADGDSYDCAAQSSAVSSVCVPVN